MKLESRLEILWIMYIYCYVVNTITNSNCQNCSQWFQQLYYFLSMYSHSRIKLPKCWLSTPATQFYYGIKIHAHINGLTTGIWSASMGWKKVCIHSCLCECIIDPSSYCLFVRWAIWGYSGKQKFCMSNVELHSALPYVLGIP